MPGVGVRGGLAGARQHLQKPRTPMPAPQQRLFWQHLPRFMGRAAGWALGHGPGCLRMMLWDLPFHGQTPNQPPNLLPALPPAANRGSRGVWIMPGWGQRLQTSHRPPRGWFCPPPVPPNPRSSFSRANPDATTFPWARWKGDADRQTATPRLKIVVGRGEFSQGGGKYQACLPKSLRHPGL